MRQQNNNNSVGMRKGQYENTETSLEAAAVAGVFPSTNNSVDLLKGANSQGLIAREATRRSQNDEILGESTEDLL